MLQYYLACSLYKTISQSDYGWLTGTSQLLCKPGCK